MSFSIRTGTIEEVIAVHHQIPEFGQKITRDKLTNRLYGKDCLILLACFYSKPIAYKVGYAVSSTEFYSWLGGVALEYRKNGVATKLREAQEAWATQNNYSALSVKSMNRYPVMLQLLISGGYQICGYQNKGCEANSKINFVKNLVSGGTTN